MRRCGGCLGCLGQPVAAALCPGCLTVRCCCPRSPATAVEQPCLSGCLARWPPPNCLRPPRCSYPLRLAFFWTMQGLWAWACLLPVTASHALRCVHTMPDPFALVPRAWLSGPAAPCLQSTLPPAGRALGCPLHRPIRSMGCAAPACSRELPAAARRLSFGPSLVAGLALFGGGLLLESVADWQKFKWKSDPGERLTPAAGTWEAGMIWLAAGCQQQGASGTLQLGAQALAVYAAARMVRVRVASSPAAAAADYSWLPALATRPALPSLLSPQPTLDASWALWACTPGADTPTTL